MSELLLKLAAECERHAKHHFERAADNARSDQTSVDLHSIDSGLACLERASALRARAAVEGGDQ